MHGVHVRPNLDVGLDTERVHFIFKMIVCLPIELSGGRAIHQQLLRWRGCACVYGQA